MTTDIKENVLHAQSTGLLKILLKDMSSQKNLIWATDMYKKHGSEYNENSHIEPELITGKHGNIIKPRVEKSKKEQQARAKTKAEVFTPSWICNAQNNLIDTAWFEKENVFNTETEKAWITHTKKITFPNTADKNWQSYVALHRLEITCGEAPYITSRYDAVTGEYIEAENRIGLLDRKLRVIGENTDNEKAWLQWALEALKATYGFDWQGDNVLLARENLLYTVIEHFEKMYNKQPATEYIAQCAEIIAWNIWQMDGLKFVIPNSCVAKKESQLDFFEEDTKTKPCEGCAKNNHRLHTGIYCIIKDWAENKTLRFVEMLNMRNTNKGVHHAT